MPVVGLPGVSRKWGLRLPDLWLYGLACDANTMHPEPISEPCGPCFFPILSVESYPSVTSIIAESKTLQEAQELFELFQSDYIMLQRCSEELLYLKSLWDMVGGEAVTAASKRVFCQAPPRLFQLCLVLPAAVPKPSEL